MLQAGTKPVSSTGTPELKMSSACGNRAMSFYIASRYSGQAKSGSHVQINSDI